VSFSVDLEINSIKLTALTEEMCLALQRSSRSLYVKETADYACALAGPDGYFVAYPGAMGVSGFVGLNVMKAVEEASKHEPLQPGDVIITNDPYATGGLATHLPDIHMISPYFHNGEIVAYGWCFVHCADIGGRVPSSVSPFNTSIYAEGLQIPPVKLVRGGEVVEDVKALLHRNSRTPDINEGDFKAMIGSLVTGGLRVAEMIEATGLETFFESCKYGVEQVAARANRVFRSLGEGKARAVDYLDNDAISPVPVRVTVEATLHDGELKLDFTGSDPQVSTAFNIASFGTVHAWLTTRVLALISTIDPSIPLNIGLLRHVSLIAPEGTVVHAKRPAPVGVRAATATRVNDLVNEALIQLAPEQLPAASSGVAVPVVISEWNGVQEDVQVVEPVVGGTAAWFGSDGVDGRESGLSNLANSPVETVEAEICVRVLKYAIRNGSGGVGKWRGGCGLNLTFEAIRDCNLMMRGLERMTFRPWGYNGGGAGEATLVIINEGTDREYRPRNVDVLPLAKGDTVTLLTPGAGGYGDPFERDIEAVSSDVRRRRVTVESAAKDYGVVLDENGVVDLPATEALRATPREGVSPVGPERDRWDEVFEIAQYDRMIDALFSADIVDRNDRKHKIIGSVLEELPEGFPRVAADAAQIATARERFASEIAAIESER